VDIHKPKAVHSVREFLIEIGTIICGILIALSLEQGIEWLHWHEAVSQARESLRDEMAEQLEYFDARVAVAPCVDRHIDQAQALLEQSAGSHHKPQAANVGMRLGQALPESEWASERAAQTIVHFPRSERSGLSAFYGLTEDLARWRNEEEAVWDGIAVLDGPARDIEPGEIASLRADLSHARRLALLWRLNAGTQLKQARSLGVTPRSDPGRREKYIQSRCTPVRIG
jgi:hypothetical protein